MEIIRRECVAVSGSSSLQLLKRKSPKQRPVNQIKCDFSALKITNEQIVKDSEQHAFPYHFPLHNNGDGDSGGGDDGGGDNDDGGGGGDEEEEDDDDGGDYDDGDDGGGGGRGDDDQGSVTLLLSP